VFLSMVAIPESVRAESGPKVQQRMNVAMSRACDRVYLVRSVSLSDLRPGDIKLDVLNHFKDPMAEGGAAHDQSMLERCQSGFERDVCKRLMDANYRTRAQVSAGKFSIDLVVEGADDRRLAIELDGDHWHGPDRWHRDMSRQASLERAGWTFWRVYGSQWIAHQEHHWEDLVEMLERLGIEPVGAAASNDVFSETREFEYKDDRVISLVTVEHDTTDVERDDAEAEVGSKENGAETLVADDSRNIDEIDNTIQETVVDETKSTLVIEDHHDSEIDDTVRVDIESSDSSNDNVVDIRDAVPHKNTPTEYSNVDFNDPKHEQVLSDRLNGIVDQTGPIDLQTLVRIVATEYGFQRARRATHERVRSILARDRNITLCAETSLETVWPLGQFPSDSLPWKP